MLPYGGLGNPGHLAFPPLPVSGKKCCGMSLQVAQDMVEMPNHVLPKESSVGRPVMVPPAPLKWMSVSLIGTKRLWGH